MILPTLALIAKKNIIHDYQICRQYYVLAQTATVNLAISSTPPLRRNCDEVNALA